MSKPTNPNGANTPNQLISVYQDPFHQLRFRNLPATAGHNTARHLTMDLIITRQPLMSKIMVRIVMYPSLTTIKVLMAPRANMPSIKTPTVKTPTAKTPTAKNPTAKTPMATNPTA